MGFVLCFARRKWLQRTFYLGIVLCILQQSAFAEVWGYVDDKGVAHFAAQRLDARYELFSASPNLGLMGTGAGAGAATGAGLGDAARSAASAVGASASATALTALGSASGAGTARGVQPKLLVFFDTSAAFKVVKHHLLAASATYRIDYELLQALIATESGFDSSAVSVKGAVGLMQVLPDTARRYGLQDDKRNTVAAKLLDAKTNINLGAHYLRDLIDLFPTRLDLALAAYNAGEGAVQRAGNKIPNYPETRDYVATVVQLYSALKPMSNSSDKPARLGPVGGAIGRGNMPVLVPLPGPSPRP